MYIRAERSQGKYELQERRMKDPSKHCPLSLTSLDRPPTVPETDPQDLQREVESGL